MIPGRNEPGKIGILNDMSARGLSWPVALISLGAVLGAGGSASGAGLTAGSDASLSGLEGSSAAVTPANLVGIEQKAAVDLLGPPTATESRAPADIWRYTSSQCELELVFYMEMRTGRMRSLHYVFKGDAENPAQRQACLTALVQQSQGGPGDKRPADKAAVESPPEQEAVLAAPEPNQASVYGQRPRRATFRRHWRRYASHPVRWGYIVALRYPQWSADPTRGWGGGLFGPAPYTASGPQ